MDSLAEYIQFGASPRASINLNLASKAAAFFDGREYVLPEDIKEIARSDARAALDACHFEELVTALTDMKTRFERCLVLNGTDQQYADMATKDAGDVLAKVKDQ